MFSQDASSYQMRWILVPDQGGYEVVTEQWFCASKERQMALNAFYYISHPETVYAPSTDASFAPTGVVVLSSQEGQAYVIGCGEWVYGSSIRYIWSPLGYLLPDNVWQRLPSNADGGGDKHTLERWVDVAVMGVVLPYRYRGAVSYDGPLKGEVYWPRLRDAEEVPSESKASSIFGVCQDYDIPLHFGPVQIDVKEAFVRQDLGLLDLPGEVAQELGRIAREAP